MRIIIIHKFKKKIYIRNMHKFHTISPNSVGELIFVVRIMITATATTVLKQRSEPNANQSQRERRTNKNKSDSTQHRWRQRRRRETNWIVFMCSKYFSMCTLLTWIKRYTQTHLGSGRINEAIVFAHIIYLIVISICMHYKHQYTDDDGLEMLLSPSPPTKTTNKR